MSFSTEQDDDDNYNASLKECFEFHLAGFSSIYINFALHNRNFLHNVTSLLGTLLTPTLTSYSRNSCFSCHSWKGKNVKKLQETTTLMQTNIPVPQMSFEEAFQPQLTSISLPVALFGLLFRLSINCSSASALWNQVCNKIM